MVRARRAHMRTPIRFARANLVFTAPDEVWALYRVELAPYEGLSGARKRQLLADLASFAYSVEADFTLARVTRGWSPEQYAVLASVAFDRQRGHRAQWNRYVAAQQDLLG